jgi:hypothetical protein
MRRLLLRLACGLAFLTAGRTALLVGQYQIDVKQAFPITPVAGEWVVCVATYTGPAAPELAYQMANYIRSKYSQPAFIFNRGDEERRQRDEELKKIREKFPDYRARTTRILEQCAVLVGGFKDQEAATAGREKIRTWPLPDIKPPPGSNVVAFDYQFVPVPKEGGGYETVPQPVNPFAKAMVVRNPTVRQQQQQSKWDPGWPRLNEGEDYSLLKCPKPWTLVIKQYVGPSTVQEQTASGGILSKLWPFGNNPGEGISAAGLQAHELARVLRKLNFPAYVLHTRANSIVTVGEFSAEDDPEIAPMKQRIATLQQQMSSNNDPRVRDLFTFMGSPLPMEVPHP